MMDQKEAWDLVYRTQRRPWRGMSEAEFPFSSGDSVLDVGCGNGKSSMTLIGMGCRVTGVDLSTEAVRCCSAAVPGMRCLCASADDLPFGDGEFDGIVMNHVLEHLTPEEAVATASEAERVLRRGGRVFVRSFSTDDMRSSPGTVVKGNGIRYRYFCEQEVRGLFSSFSVISVSESVRGTKFGERRSRIEGVFERT